MNRLMAPLSRVASLPILRHISPPAIVPSQDVVRGYLRCQRLAMAAAHEVAELMQPGWTEIQAATLMDEYLHDNGVKAFFHRSFCWIGERTRFEGVKTYRDFLPTGRVLRENEVFILDVAPILDGYIADIGYTVMFGDDSEFKVAMQFLKDLRAEIPRLIHANNKGSAVWKEIDKRFQAAGFDNIHALYPFSVLGHRVHRVTPTLVPVHLINFGWQSFWAFLSRGLFGQLLNQDHDGSLNGLWAIEPHIGAGRFGAKFEEILVVEDDKSYWLEDAHV